MSWQAILLIVAIVILLGLKKFYVPTLIYRFLQEHWRVSLVLFTLVVAVVAFWEYGVHLGLDLRGGSELLYRIRYEDIPPAERGGITNQTIGIIERRLNPKGTKELRIQEHGPFRILLQLPGATGEETERIKRLIEKAGKLEFRMVNSDEADRVIAQQGKRVAGCTPYVFEGTHGFYRKSSFKALPSFTGEWLLVSNRVELTGGDLKRSYPSFDDMGAPAVGFEFKPGAGRKFARLTERNIGKRLAIVLDNILYSAPVIESRISDRGIIKGRFTQQEVNDLVITLQSGSLPADLQLEMENSVGPTLGEDSIRKGIAAALVGMVLVMGFMAAYYLFAGAVADVALLMNLILVVGALSILEATLTLPGIAGLVLTVGMAVDANVLIYERIREEKEKDKAIRLAIKNGYERAFTTIVDANLTTLITAVILLFVGTGPVKGFGVTLSLGIIMSMYTALFVTRSIFEWMLGRGYVKELRMFRLIGVTHVKFTEVRRIAMGASLTLIVLGLAVFAVRGKKKYDIDFTGGTLLQLELQHPITIGEARQNVQEAGYPEAEVQSIWRGGETSLGGKTTEFGIRIPAGAFEEDKIGEIVRYDILTACGGQEGVKSISLEDSLTAKMQLKHKISEAKLREALAALGYRGSVIEMIEGEETKAKKYQIELLRSATPEERKIARAAIEKALSDLVHKKEIGYTFGGVSQMPMRDETAPQLKFQIQMDLDEPVGLEIIERELKKMTGKDLEARGRGTQSGQDVCDRLTIIGDEMALRKLEELGGGAFEIAAIKYDESAGMYFELSQGMTEGEMRQRLKHALNSVQGITPLDVESSEFTIVLRDLPEIKREQKIRKDLMAKFAGNLLMEKSEIEFEPSSAPKEEAPEEKSETTREVKYFDLKIPKGMSPDLIKARFIKAGYGDLLRISAEDLMKEKLTAVTFECTAEEESEMKEALRKAFEVPDPFSRVVSIGATVAEEMKNRAFLALFFALGAIIFYIWFRFGELKFGIAAVLALAHDVLITMGVISLADWLGEGGYGRLLMLSEIKINLPMVAAFLTIVGYSLNDTIVVFDRIRENISGPAGRAVTADIIDRSVNQTLGRTLLTSLTTLAVVVVLYVVGGPVIHGFAFALIVGIIVGTYSSIFIASPVLLEWDRFRRGRKKT